MKITRDNYEAYFLDYLEGNLENERVDDFNEFLQENPDLKEELELIGSVSVEPENHLFTKKEKLYKQKYDNGEEFEKAAVALIEGELPAKEKAAFEAYVSAHPGKEKELELFQKTKLPPDDHIMFHDKKRLYRSSKGKTLLLWVTRIAAVVAIAFLAGRFGGEYFFSRMQPENRITVSENKNENPKTKSLSGTAEVNEEPVSVNEKPQAPVKKQESKTQPHKSLRESNSGRIDHEKVALERTPVEVPDKIPTMQASLHKEKVEIASLIPVEYKSLEMPSAVYEERFLADMVKEKTGLENLSLNKIAKAGLNLISGFSREKFQYQTNPEGQVTELNFDSRLLAFSIPTNQD